MTEQILTINLVLDNKTVEVPYTNTTTAEDVCIHVCKSLGIGPLARHLFALRLTGKYLFLTPSACFGPKYVVFDLRIRFKVSRLQDLRKLDARAYDYFFHQARIDLLKNKIPDMVFEKFKKELVGLGITDMYRVMLEKDIPKEIVENEYRKYIPKEVLKRHAFFIKKPIRETLSKLQKTKHDVGFVKDEYLNQLNLLAPDYLSETYKAVMDQDGSTIHILIKVSPPNSSSENDEANLAAIKYSLESKKDKWQLIGTIEDMAYVSIRIDGTVEISRTNGIPFYLKFNALPSMWSFISLLDGYYRLSCKWTFNICKDAPTPSLQKLYIMKCHGPVGGEFSYAKLEEKRSNRPGCFIIRESETKYNQYFIDVCIKNSSKPKTFKLEKISKDEYIFNDDLTRYKNIHQLISAYNNPNGPIFLQECLPPSEYDKSPLLLCHKENLSGSALADASSLSVLIPKIPICIDCNDLQVYKLQKKHGSQGITLVHRCMWKITKTKKIEVAMKLLKEDCSEKYLKSFLNLTGSWAFLQSKSIVKLYGITLTPNVSMVMEYFRLGPLNTYLKKHKNILKTVDLIEAGSSLASALWYLSEKRIVHGNIRCRKLMVDIHDDNSFIVKLMDPGIHTSYGQNEVYWIPVECYSNLDYARRSSNADVWAFATTLYEIFTFGEEINLMDPLEAKEWFRGGKTLPKPPECPDNIYHVMRECWYLDSDRRKHPQAIMRDINQILYQVYNSRRQHSYAKVFTKSKVNGTPSISGLSTSSMMSNNTESTLLCKSEDIANSEDGEISECSSYSGGLSQCALLSSQDMLNQEDTQSCNFSNILSSFNFPTSVTSLDSMNSLQSIFELDECCNVVLQGRIGQGFYGEVYKATLEYYDNTVQNNPRQVAVKKLKSSGISSSLQDFEREINIMKTLQHPNIVEILGVVRDPEILLIMEFVQHGSLQSYLKINKDSLHTKQLLKYALDIAKGMHYLGQKNIVHRDLAARNILVVDENHIKISDFGLAQAIGTNEYYILKTNRELPIKWYAPESLRDGKFSVRSDVWSFGVTMCEMFNCGEEPKLANMDDVEQKGQEQEILLNALATGARFPCPPMCPQAVHIRIIYPCWQNDPHERPSFSKLISETEDLLTQY
ncbi:tyrosine-protein kinase hopscotch isoform X2 [Harmonia axyridis]|uniref:tyrosine-protein kinase hopscotch isoform X2 n=1 Tax=Harmonia axyridis TaxID=115357 RepID=UPI001E276B9E|nr:tyrosine-protein kinase hopscotch isoform X2 [Harmonia axyridis]